MRGKCLDGKLNSVILNVIMHRVQRLGNGIGPEGTGKLVKALMKMKELNDLRLVRDLIIA